MTPTRNMHTNDSEDNNGANPAAVPGEPGAGALLGIANAPLQGHATLPVSLPAGPQGNAPASLPHSMLPTAFPPGDFTAQPNKDTAEFLPQHPSLFRVGIKVPPFWTDKPTVWFAQLEGQFQLAGITSDTTKFYHAMAHLDHQIAAEVEDVITNPPNENKYLALKSELIRRLSVSQEQKEKQLLMHEELGSRKPSQFLRHLLHLAGPNKLPESFIRTVWSSRLPIHLQTIVASHPDMPLVKLSELADHVHEIASPSFRIAEVSPNATPMQATSSSALNPFIPPQMYSPVALATPSTSPAFTPYTAPQQHSPLEAMSLQIAELSRQMAALTNHVFEERSRSQSRSLNRNNNRARSKSGARSQVRNGVCWYHRRFGSDATRCTHPCEYKAEN